MAKYSIKVEDSEDNELVYASGSIYLATYTLGEVKDTLQHAGVEKFSVSLRDEDKGEVITELTANGRTAFAVLKTELASLRKQHREQAAASEQPAAVAAQ